MKLAIPLPRALDGRSSRRAVAFQEGGFSGLRVEGFSSEALRGAIEGHERAAEILKRDHRALVTASVVDEGPIVVKEVTKGGILRRSADSYRGSPARRAWLGGHGLIKRGISAALPLAFVESRRGGIPLRSFVVLEDLRPARAADGEAASGAEQGALAETLLELVLALHRSQIEHGDLQAQHLFLQAKPGNARANEAVLIDLEGVRFPQQLSDERRIRALAQLNASLSEQQLGDSLRREIFERYAKTLPFRGDERKALARIVSLSLARRHAWSGRECPAQPASRTH